jgi:hypothetical protein
MRNNIRERMPGISAVNNMVTAHKKTPTNAEVLSIRNVILNFRQLIKIDTQLRLDDGNHQSYH